jgi:ribosomal protein S18 acetylase RimI-like enzyme
MRVLAVAWPIVLENAGARALYERMGFAVTASRPMRHYPDGTQPGKDWLLMVKEH